MGVARRVRLVVCEVAIGGVEARALRGPAERAVVLAGPFSAGGPAGGFEVLRAAEPMSCCGWDGGRCGKGSVGAVWGWGAVVVVFMMVAVCGGLSWAGGGPVVALGVETLLDEVCLGLEVVVAVCHELRHGGGDVV